MAKQTVLENEYISVWYYADKKIIHHQMHKFVSGPVFHESLLKGAQLMETYKACKWLSDDRSNGVVTKEDQAWGETNWVPRVIKAGWKYWAIVQPAKVIAQMSMKPLIDGYGKLGVTVKLFTTPEEAMKWLESQ